MPENDHPELVAVKVVMTGANHDHPLCIANGSFLYKSDASDYQFTPMIVPELPE